jgi:hypothetical protein
MSPQTREKHEAAAESKGISIEQYMAKQARRRGKLARKREKKLKKRASVLGHKDAKAEGHANSDPSAGFAPGGTGDPSLAEVGFCIDGTGDPNLLRTSRSSIIRDSRILGSRDSQELSQGESRIVAHRTKLGEDLRRFCDVIAEPDR